MIFGDRQQIAVRNWEAEYIASSPDAIVDCGTVRADEGTEVGSREVFSPAI
jgi:hypothetical protein